MRTATTVFFAVLASTISLTAQSFLNYESGQVNPIRMTPDGLRLLICNTPDSRLAVWSTQVPNQPRLLHEIPVGLEPVSVAARTNDEVWVANQLSDSVSIVSLSLGRVVATLQAKDEPSDIAFAGNRAFVTTATNDRVLVFDVNTRQQVGTVNVFGKDPRALAVNPQGTKVYALVQRSGNKTTILERDDAPPQPAPTNTSLPTPPDEGMIVTAGDPQWPTITWTLPDYDVAEIDAASLTVTRNFSGVGTTNFHLAVHPVSGDLFVANTNARNLVRFEPVVRGHAIDSRITRVTTAAVPVTTHFDLNAGLNYISLPDPNSRAIALSEPSAVAINAANNELYVAAFGTDRVGVLNASTGAVLARIEMSPATGATVNSLSKRGPRGLALHPSAGRLYVLNRLASSLSTIDVSGRVVLNEQPLGGWDPTPPNIRDGRKFLYDAKLAGNGSMSCASCHVDGDVDGLGWDLGDPSGSMAAAPTGQPFPFNVLLTQFHPMKGPMTTQSLRGLGGSGALHWRGDRATFQHFNPAFASLLGGTTLGTADMDLFAGFAMNIALPPNPNQPMNRAYLTSPSNANQQQGLNNFSGTVVNFPVIGNVSCNTCHALPTGSNELIVTGSILQEPQQMKVPRVRMLNRKSGFDSRTGPQKAGFGFTHDGAVTNLTEFLQLPQFNSWPTTAKDDIVQFLLAADTGTAPLVGHQFALDSANNGTAAQSEWNLMQSRALAGDIDLVARGSILGEPIGLILNTASMSYVSSVSGVGPFQQSQLLALAQSGQASLVFMGVHPGGGERTARDRDNDGVLDGNEGVALYGSATPGTNGNPIIGTNSDPWRGNTNFAFTSRNVPANAAGWFALSLAATNWNAGGLTINVEVVNLPALLVPMTADGRGVAVMPLAVPNDPAFAGLTVMAQFVWMDQGAAVGWSGTRGLALTIQ
jgi:DNA-binding beta-propeller fold protein YncE